jgi:hypothetical protein
MERRRLAELLLATVLDQLNRPIDFKMFVGPGNEGPLYPMVNRGCIPD